MTIFHFGYWGWGNHTPKLVETFDSIERARGYGPPVFVDIRITRQVRAQGFNGNAFGELLGDRYMWMKELGNPNIIGAAVDRSVDRPDAARDLLDLAVKFWRDGRRVVFFCSCERVDECHRAAVRDLLHAQARRRNLDCVIVEWPGGIQTVHSLSLDPKAWKATLKGTNQVPLGDDMPPPGLTAMPWASVLKLECGPEYAWIITGPARFSNGRWRLPILQVFTEDEDRPQERAENMAAKMRKQVWGLLTSGVPA
jgi:hypothetical protein